LREIFLEIRVKTTIKPRNKRTEEKAWSSEKGHKVDALALGAEERRDKLRKAAGSCK
jgi:hypothetical protein